MLSTLRQSDEQLQLVSLNFDRHRLKLPRRPKKIKLTQLRASQNWRRQPSPRLSGCTLTRKLHFMRQLGSLLKRKQPMLPLKQLESLMNKRSLILPRKMKLSAFGCLSYIRQSCERPGMLQLLTQ